MTKTVDIESSLLFPESNLKEEICDEVASPPLLQSYRRLLGGVLFDERVRFEEESGARSGCVDELKCIGSSRLLAYGSPCVGCAGTQDAAACCPLLGNGKEDGKASHGRSSGRTVGSGKGTKR